MAVEAECLQRAVSDCAWFPKNADTSLRELAAVSPALTYGFDWLCAVRLDTPYSCIVSFRGNVHGCHHPGMRYR